ncbi:rsbT co-antagonist protein RsbR [Terribacillus halophilus]|uniref:RsbT co-antagonist protein RsbR n=1 Tax=Terribacillus halophilus TaxID=361279 RepID=A0A1G6UAT1_9BACI|nr:STAS domain-containing protein [Terribacillus halophilus]SDD38478.1 rsbT co-antagonist protein RsbR [Terribacillus halophilus]
MLYQQELHQHFLKNIDEIVEKWYAAADKTSGVYAVGDPEVIARLKDQNRGFHRQFCEVLNQDSNASCEAFEDWIASIAKDDRHLDTPIDAIINEFYRNQALYLELLRDFCKEKNVDAQTALDYYEKITDSFNQVIVWFIRENAKQSEFKLQAQQEMILELSTPVISLTPNVALLPLVGEIDTNRAQFMMDNVLHSCATLEVDHLFIDMSGVVVIDTLVAQRIFSIIEALKLLGVETILSGMRPEIAQTSTQLGIPLHKLKTTSSLKNAVEKIMLAR